ncbi:hypothetical protein Hanom_Chr10g00876621 [Helianthus anomalus]
MALSILTSFRFSAHLTGHSISENLRKPNLLPEPSLLKGTKASSRFSNCWKASHSFCVVHPPGRFETKKDVAFLSLTSLFRNLRSLLAPLLLMNFCQGPS